MSVHLVLLALAAICFLVGAIGLKTGRVNAVALGLLFWLLTLFTKG